MAVLSSTVQPASDSFKENRSSMFELIDHWRGLEQRTIDASNKRLKTFRARGQLSPRERLERLLDPGMPFLQMHSMANYCVENPDRETSVPGGSVIVGVGFVEGVRCMIWVDDSGISAGAATESTGFVSTSILEMCMRQKLPVIHLVESAGANLLKYKVELWSRFGNVFRDLARLSAAGIPTMVVLHGGSTAGGAYMPGMSDYVIGVKENGMAALGGAALVKAATGEEADDRELGGTEMHSSVSGVVEYLVEDDAHGILKAREVMKSIDWNKRVTTVVRRPYEPPRFPAEELAGAIPVDPKVPYDFREVLARVVDDSSVEEFKSRYGVSTV
ncbi:MAG: carboxyl transferase domain-containing protein, partial [Luminiphilus sp.]